MGPSSTNEHGPDPHDGSTTTGLAGGFDKPSEQDWLELVEKVLKGAPPEKLESRTAGGLRVLPLYTDANTEIGDIGEPGEAPFVRGESRDDDEGVGWALRVEIDVDSLERVASVGGAGDGASGVVSQRALEALERGATELALIGSFGDGNEVTDGVDRLDAALEGVMVDLAPIHLRPGARFDRAAQWLTELWERRGVEPASARGGFGADPLGTLASRGTLDRPVDAALEALGALAARTAGTHPQVRSISVDSTPYANAGAGEVEELAITLSTGAAYLRACAAAGVEADTACRQIEFTLSTDADIFTGVAKLRAARRLWAVVADSCGASSDSRSAHINVRTSEAMMTRRDPWVNLLRVTAASLAAALGGAESLTTLPYDLRLSDHGELGRRMARNTQLLLQEESNLARVMDPMGGSWYLESLTDELAREAWARFQELERAGGMPAVLVDGTVRSRIEEGVKDRLALIATRRIPITGVSEFPNLEEPLLEAGAEPDRATAAHSGASRASDAAAIEPLSPVHWAGPFEDLRDRSDRFLAETGARPKVFLVNLGPVSKHTARATFARNFYAAGGIEAVTSETGSSAGFSAPQQAIEDARASGVGAICVCSSDDLYAEDAQSFVEALAGADLGPIHLAGRPKDIEGALQTAGVDRFIYVGVDVLDVLTDLHSTFGTPEVNS